MIHGANRCRKVGVALARQSITCCVKANTHIGTASDAAEIWHYHPGASLALSLSSGAGPTEGVRLGTDLASGESPQVIAAAGIRQSTAALGDWTLVDCTVPPAF